MNKHLLLRPFLLLSFLTAFCGMRYAQAQTFDKTYMASSGSLADVTATATNNGYHLSSWDNRTFLDTARFSNLQIDAAGNQIGAATTQVFPNPSHVHIVPASDGNYFFTGINSNKATLTKKTPAGVVLWTKEYEIPSPEVVKPGQVSHNAAGELFIVGVGVHSVYGHIYVVKAQADGTLIWVKKVFPLNSSHPQLQAGGLPTPDGGVIVLVNTPSQYITTRLNSSGDIMYDIGQCCNTISRLTIAGHGDKTILGYTSFGYSGPTANRAIVQQLNADGTFEWAADMVPYVPPFPPPAFVYSSHIGAMAKTNDGGYIVAEYASQVGDKYYMAKVDGSGNVVWIKYDYGFMANASAVVQTGDGGYLVSGRKGGQLWLMKTDANGDVAPLPATCPGNLLANAGFEDGLANWNDLGSGEISGNGAHSGTKVLKLCQQGGDDRVIQALPAVPGQQYTFSFWGREAEAGNSSGYGYLKFLTSSWQPIQPGTYIGNANSTSWQQFSKTVTAPPNAAYLEVGLEEFEATGSGCAYYDDVCLVAGDDGSNGLPDLVPIVQLGNTSASNNGVITFTAAAKNQGAFNSNFIGYDVYLSDDAIWSPNNDVFLSDLTGSFQHYELDPGETSDVRTDFYHIAASNTFNGTKYLLVVLDRSENIEESNESNNVFSFPIHISTPPVPTGCVQTLGPGDILCTEKSGDNLEVYLRNNQVVTQYTLNGHGSVIGTQNLGPWVMDSVLVQGNQLVKKLANGTIAFSKTIPPSVLNALPTVQVAAELTDGTFVLTGYVKPNNLMPLTPSRNSLVLVHTDANLNPVEVKAKVLGYMGNPYFTFNDVVMAIFPSPGAAFDVLYTSTTEGTTIATSLHLSRFSFNQPQSFDVTPIYVTDGFDKTTSTVVKTPCDSYRFIGPVGTIGQDASFFGRQILYYAVQDLALLAALREGSGNVDYFGDYDRWDFNTPSSPYSLSGVFQHRRGFDESVPNIGFKINNPTPPNQYIEVPYFNYLHAVLMEPSDIFLFGSNNGQIFVEVPTDCAPLVVLQPDLTGDNLTLPANAVYAPGADYSFSLTVRNNGNDASTSLTMTPYFSTDAVLSANDFQGSDFSTYSIQPDEQRNEYDYGSLPANLPPGSYYVLVKIDADNANTESNENNNIVASTTKITVSGGNTGQMDLSLALQQLTASPAQWSNYQVKATVSNAGPQAATGVKVKFAKPNGVVYVGGNSHTSSQGSFNPNGDEVWSLGSIPANGTAILTVNYFLLQNGAPAAYAQVTAANETDGDSQPNNGTPPMPVQDDEASTSGSTGGGGPTPQPDLTLADLQIPSASVAAGAILSYNFDASNAGTAAVSGNFTIKSYISTDNVLSANDVQDGTINTGNFTVGLSQNNVPGASTIPATLAAGSYYLIVKIDGDNAVAESNEANNVVVKPFTVTGGGGNGNGGNPGCASITVTPAPGSITIAGASAPHVLIKVFRPNWTVAFECLDNCANPLVVSGLTTGTHHIEVKLLNSNWGEICVLRQDVNLSTLGGNGTGIAQQDDRLRLSFDKFYPNPAQYLVNMELYSPTEQAATLDFYNQQGQRVHTMQVQLDTGVNGFDLLVNDWKSGTYNVIARGAETGLPAYGRFMKVWEE